MTIVRGGALPTEEALHAAMKKAGMIALTHEEQQAALEAAFAEDDPEQQEWVISGQSEEY